MSSKTAEVDRIGIGRIAKSIDLSHMRAKKKQPSSMSGCNSVGRMTAFQAVRRGFEPRHPLQFIRNFKIWY